VVTLLNKEAEIEKLWSRNNEWFTV